MLSDGLSELILLLSMMSIDLAAIYKLQVVLHTQSATDLHNQRSPTSLTSGQ